MKLLGITRKGVLIIAGLLLAVFGLALLRLLLLYSTAPVYLIVFYAVLIGTAVGFVWLVKRFQPRAVFVYGGLCVFTIAVLSVICLNGFFVGEGDLQTYYSNAVKLAQDEPLNNLYSATFPGTVTYPFVLSLFMRVFGVSTAVPVGLNIAVVCGLACAVYAFLRRRMSMAWSLAGALLLVLHPFTLLYTNTCNAELLYGAFVFFAFSAFDKALACDDKRRLLWFIVTGLLCGLSTLFRPLTLILILAFLLYLVVFHTDHRLKKLLYCIILVGLFWLTSQLNSVIVKSTTGYNAPSASYGWNLYVGASPTGRWNAADAEEFNKVSAHAHSPSEIQQHFASLAFERYRTLGVGTVSHGLRKLSPWLAYGYIADETITYTNEAKFPFKAVSDSTVTIVSIVDITIMALALGQCLLLLWQGFRGKFNTLLVQVFYLLGSLIVLMLLELAPRYTVSYRLTFCLLALFALQGLWRKIKEKTPPPIE